MRKNNDLAAWRLFFRIVELGSLSKAADESGVEPSSVSRRLTALEQAVGVQLLLRSTRTLKLTDAGVLAYEQMHKLVDEMDTVAMGLSEQRHELSGTVRITASVTIGQLLLPKWIAGFQQAHPAVNVDVLLSDGFTNLLVDRIDMALRIGPVMDEGLIARRLGEVPMVMCATPAYLAKHGRPHKPADLADHRFLMYSGFVDQEKLSLEKDGLHEKLDLQCSLSINNVLALYHAARADAGIGLVPLWLCVDDFKQGRLIHILPDWKRPAIQARAVRLPQRHTSKRVTAFIGWLEQCWGETPGLES